MWKERIEARQVECSKAFKLGVALAKLQKFDPGRIFLQVITETRFSVVRRVFQENRRCMKSDCEALPVETRQS